MWVVLVDGKEMGGWYVWVVSYKYLSRSNYDQSLPIGRARPGT